MLGQIFSSLGGAIGGAYGGGILSTVGRFAGRKLGNYLEKSMIEPDEYYIHHGCLSNMYLESLAEGRPIPIAFGRVKLAGNMIWALPLKEVRSETSSKTKHPGTNIAKTIYHDSKYKYFASFALAICKGEISDIGRVWANGEILDISEYQFRIYNGTADQMPDPLIVEDRGKGATPAFRDLAYIVFEDLPIEIFGNRVPNFSFEVIRKTSSDSVEDLVNEIVIGPGIGEFSYDTVIQNKIRIASGSSVVLSNVPVNCNNHKRVADALFNLNKLQSTCKNLQWVSPRVIWFGDNLNVGSCNILPKVEHKDPQVRTSEEWRVAGFNRSNATEVPKDPWGIPTHDGTINDASLVRYLNELKSRGVKIMLHPSFSIDVAGNLISGSENEIRNFFNKVRGYKNFILHYANLVKGKVDAFLIGSGLSSITQKRFGNICPASEELIDLAGKVKAILGRNVLVTYAADWSECHINEDGFYNMDDLWACEHIDVVGINAYLQSPMTSGAQLNHEQIWRNIADWWAGFHITNSGVRTRWQPRSKKIWLTEFGFLRDGTSDGNGNIECGNIKTIIGKFKNSAFIEKIFFKEWDVHPYKNFSDDEASRTFQSINKNFGTSSLGDVLEELCIITGVPKRDVDVITLKDMVGGLVVKNHAAVIDIINMLRCVYFFDILTTDAGKVKFIKRGSKNSLPVQCESLIKNSETGYVKLSNIAQTSMVRGVNLCFIDSGTYKNKYCNYHLELESNVEISKMDFPIVMNGSEAEYLAHNIISSAVLEDKIFKIRLPISYLYLEPTDILCLNLGEREYQLRITDIVVSGIEIKITAVTF